jgi:hypothetical protein
MNQDNHRIYKTAVSAVYPLYITKVERKNRTQDELAEVTRWLTGFTDTQIQTALDENWTFEKFFAEARLNPNAPLITGMICGVRIEEIENPLMQKIRYWDKLVDELAKGRPMAKILRLAS